MHKVIGKAIYVPLNSIAPYNLAQHASKNINQQHLQYAYQLYYVHWYVSFSANHCWNDIYTIEIDDIAKTFYNDNEHEQLCNLSFTFLAYWICKINAHITLQI